jgi:triacylglycerol lipase
MDSKNPDLKFCINLTKLVYTNKDLTSEYSILIDHKPITIEATENSTKDARMYIVLNKDTLIIIFRGANIITTINDAKQQPFLDIICSNNFPRNTYKDLKVHSGFLTQFNNLKFQMIELINKYKGRINNIIFVGHSLGGALATLAATCCKSHYPNYIISCVTFGSPKVGNSTFSRYFNDTVDYSKRIVYGDDSLTKMPDYFYKHVDTKLEIGEHSSSWFDRRFGLLEHNYIDNYLNFYNF